MRTGHTKIRAARPTGALGALLATIAASLLLTLAFSSSALAAPPTHPRTPALDLSGLNHACGVATDSKGDLYASSAGEGKVKVFNSSHTLLTEISNPNTPCALAITTTGNLYVTEQATGHVIRYAPSAYPPTGSTTYTPTTIDSSGNAKGIAVDPLDNRLYVAEGTKVAVYSSSGSFEANALEGKVGQATGVAAYTYVAAKPSKSPYLYLSVADAEGDEVEIFSGTSVATLKHRRSVAGIDQDRNPETPDQEFGFGAQGAYLTADSGNEEAATHKCKQVAGQACTAGHLYLYDASHDALDELDATGEFVDQTTSAAFADAQPTQVAIDRSGGSGDGTVYVSAGASTGAKLLAFAPLAAPSRALVTSLSHVLPQALAVATDDRGDLYAVSQTTITIYNAKGEKVTSFEDAGTGNAQDLALDSKGNVYVLDGFYTEEQQLTYYHPSSYPPTASTTYTRHEPALIEFGEGMSAIAVNPADDHVFVLGTSTVVFPPIVQEFDSAADGSGEVGECGAGLGLEGIKKDLDIDGETGEVYVSSNDGHLYAIKCGAEKEIVHEFKGGGCPSGEFGFNPAIAIDQANGHVLEYAKNQPGEGVRENETAGPCVAQYSGFGPAPEEYRLAVDNSCALHSPPLTEATTPTCKSFDPANGTAYMASDSNDNAKQPYDVTALGPLSYPEPAEHKLTLERTGKGSGEVESSPAGIDCGATCFHKFPETETVTLTATPDPGSEFTGWGSGQCEAQTASPTEGTCELAVAEEDRTVKAEFAPLAGGSEFALTVLPEGIGSGEVSSLPEGIECPATCSAEFGELVKVTLTAKADPGSEVQAWEGCETQTVSVHEGTCTVTMSEAKQVKVKLDVEHPLLSVVLNGEGTLTSEDGQIDCPGTCTHKYDLGDEVTLTAEADPGSSFLGWGEGDCEAEAEPEPGLFSCEVTMEEARQVSATFASLPGVIALPAQPVLYDEATLRGEVDPEGSPTKYHFEYLTQAEYEEAGNSFAGAKSTPEVTLEAGEATIAVSAPLTGLAEGTEYRFRLLAKNDVGPTEEEGPSFETLQRRVSAPCSNTEYRTGLSANLPDCRAYELVTPADMHGAEPNASPAPSAGAAFNNWLVDPRGEGAGESVGFFSGTLPGFEGSGDTDGYRSQRSPGDHPEAGWTTELYGPTFEQTGGGGGVLQEGVASDQRYWLWIGPGVEAFPNTLPKGHYLRTPVGAANPACNLAGMENPQPEFELVGCGTVGGKVVVDPGAESRFVSAGGSHVVFFSKEHLESEAAPAGTQAIYDRVAGSASAEVVSVKPDGSPFAGGEGANYVGASEDGSAIVFKVDGTLYLHRADETTEIAEAPDTFVGVASDGGRVLYSEGGLTSPGSIFACDIATGPCAGPGAHEPTEIAEESIVVNVSADGSRVLFTSEEPLSGEEENEVGQKAEAGESNLYLWDGSETRFVGRLAAPDFKEFGGTKLVGLQRWAEGINPGPNIGLANSPTRSTPDGAAFVFQSHAQLTDFDNEGFSEVYRYDPAAPDGQRLLCVSCESGVPATGEAMLQVFNGLAGGHTQNNTLIPNLTDDGRQVFFHSPDQLLPEDANQAIDVYEWRAQGVGEGAEECKRTRGCLALISSGQGEQATTIYGMSADGHDVFVETPEKLLAADIPGSVSLYDARIDGGIPDPTVKSSCQGDACQGQGSTPPALANPASTADVPDGNPPAQKPCPKGKRKVRKAGKARCVARHPRKHHKDKARHGAKRRNAKHNGRAGR